jgi:hypothetical protein
MIVAPPKRDVPKSSRVTGGDCARGGLYLRAHPFLRPTPTEDIAMHFCFTGQYTPQALNSMMDSPTTNRYEAAKSLIEAAGGKLISIYSPLPMVPAR